MTQDLTDPPGYSSVIHRSMLEPLLFFKQVPYKAGIAHFLFTLIATVAIMGFRSGNDAFSFALSWGIGGYCLLYWATKDDPHRVEIFAKAFIYRRYYGTR